MPSKIVGPFWQAEVTVVELADPLKNLALRTLFAENRTTGETIERQSTTLLMLADVQKVRVNRVRRGTQPYSFTRRPGKLSPQPASYQKLKKLVRSGKLVLLQVEADDTRQPAGGTRRYTCLSGEINLDRLLPQGNDRQRLYQDLELEEPDLEEPDPGPRSGAAALPGRLAAHGSGLSIYGRATLPWQDEPVAAPFQLTRLRPRPDSELPDPGARLTVERERLTSAERRDLIQAWTLLSSYVNPGSRQLNDLGPQPPAPHWVTLELANPSAVPHFYWEWDPAAYKKGKKLVLHFRGDQFRLLLSDQQPYNQTCPPATLARIALDRITLEQQGDELHLQVLAKVAVDAAEDDPGPQPATMLYIYEDQEGGPDESLEFARAWLAFDPLHTPQLLRNHQELPEPEWMGGTPDEPAAAEVESEIVWAFSPLADGWVQFPVPNLTEQIYLDAELEQFDQPPADAPAALLEGAVAFGNRQTIDAHPEEQPWNITLTAAHKATGHWVLAPEMGNGFKLTSVSLELIAPRLVVNGLLWLSTGKPTIADALPDLENWTTGLESVSLRTVDPKRDLFPPLVTMSLASEDQATSDLGGPVRLAVRPEGEHGVSAVLRSWNLSFQVDGELLHEMAQKRVLCADTFFRNRPWLWRRHPTLPMIQALPLTQSQSPPNHPSASRQLVPFRAPAVSGLVLGVPRGPITAAASWPILLSQAKRDDDWASLADLPLVALSLPGLVLDPSLPEPGLGTDETTSGLGIPGPLAGTHLPLQYRFDLPYTDEVNTLAQLPEIVPNPDTSSPLPESPPPEPPPPLTPKTFAGHWAGLSERASLAAADAVEAIADEDGQKLVRHLVEPYEWPVKAELRLKTYPGSLTLVDGADDSQMLRAESALRGISGRFVATGASGQLGTAVADEENPFLLEAGSMAAHRAEDGAFRDQRGLSRGASSLVAGSGLLQTPVQLLQKDPAETVAYRLTSLVAPIELTLDDPADSWQLWFRDLPVRATDGTFERCRVLSARAQDVNDPGALSRERDYLAGYEWRLGKAGETLPNGEVSALPLFGLDFYPLTLEEVTLNDQGVRRIELMGRLQLPLEERHELEDLSNAVRLAFKCNDSEEQLTLESVALESDAIAWPLSMERDEDGGAPRLVWDQIKLSGGQLHVGGVRLRFFLFGVEWTHKLRTLAFPLAVQKLTYDLPKPTDDLSDVAGLGIYAKALHLDLDPAAGEYNLALVLGLELGKQVPDGLPPRFNAEVKYDLLETGAGSATLYSAALFSDLALPKGTQSQISVGAGAIQFDFQLAHNKDLQLLPGMGLEPGGSAPGFAALTFTATTESPDSLPKLRLASAFVEALLSCRWGEGLQDRIFEESEAAAQVTPDQVFASSAGNLVFGYTTQLRAGQWEESLLLNGVLEVKNLISWPAEWTSPGATPDSELILLPIPADGQLHHTRHTIRVLFNQHQVPGENLVTSPDDPDLLFNLDADRPPWQFLAVVEHQLIDIGPRREKQALAASSDRRWTTLQEVRLVRPHRFRAFLADHADHRATAPIPDDGGFPTSLDYGYWDDRVRTEMMEVLDDELVLDSMILVEASAPHWIHRQPLSGVQTTTLQFLPNGSQHGALSRPEDYGPSDPSDPEWLLLPMPFLGRLHAGGGESAIQADPVLLLQQQGAAAPSLACLLSHWSKETSAPAKMLVSGFDTALGRTMARLDPTSLEENWFRLQNPVPEPQATTTQSVMATLPDTPARLSRATALRRAFDAFRPFYPPATPAPLQILAVGSTGDLVWRRDSLMTLQGIRMIEGQDIPGGDQIANGAFDPDPSTKHPLDGDPVIGWAVGDDQVPHDWEVYKFAYGEWHYQGSSSSGWTKSKISPDPQLPRPAGRRDWGLPRMRAPNPEETKPVGPRNRGTSWLLYSDAAPTGTGTPLWIKIGQSVRLARGRYRFSLSIFPAQETSGEPATDPQDSQVVLFAGPQRTRILDGSDLPFDRWSPAHLDFEVPETTNVRVGVELHGPGDFLRNGWYLNDAELVSLAELPAGWHVTATQLRGIGRDGEVARSVAQYHAAATLLPAQLAIGGTENPRPLSFTVSPYLGLEFRPVSGDPSPKLASVELLCLDLASGLLRPAASKFWEAEAGALADEEIQAWARETHRRLCPESPIAVLRHRQINESRSDDGQSAVLTTSYHFTIVTDLVRPQAMARRVFRLRTKPKGLRFREGQFGGQEMPQNVLPFEVAPPQTTGVQPLYLTQRPTSNRPGTWPWGLSALRLSVQYSRDKKGAIGALAEPTGDPDNGSSLTLWWQAPQYLVQFRAPGSNRPVWNLPALFRARAIKSLLPVLPAPPLPVVDFSEDGHQSWQPLLPGALRYLISGARAGVMLAIRNQLLRQSSLEAGQADQVGKGLVSGSVPAQHRMPRPVRLPPNQGADKALQPLASYFEPGQNLLATSSPADEAYIAECAGFPARRLLIKLVEPKRGALTDWDGELLFKSDLDIFGDPKLVSVTKEVQLQITDGVQTFTFQKDKDDENRFTLDAQDREQLLEGKVGGQVLTANARVVIELSAAEDPDPAFAAAEDPDPASGFTQTLSFPLRFVDSSHPRLPLVPNFLHFEDPEYNRRLSSQAATAATNVREEVVGSEDELHTVTLATDRREYNPDSHLALRYDWDDGGRAVEREASVSFTRIDENGIVHRLSADGLEGLVPAKLIQVSLLDLEVPDLGEDGKQVAWRSGETLQLKLKLTFPGSVNSDNDEILLDLRIVQEPVIPAPEAAYALLRWQYDETQVECVRFAWQPNANRVDLVCPADLQTGVVRRRAVFHWTDSVRPGTVNGYAIQKITLTGSTHFPQPEPVEEIWRGNRFSRPE